MRKLIVICLLLLSSCSASYHYIKAVEKDPSIVKNDTTTVIKYLPAISGEITSADSAEVDNEFLYIKAVYRDSLLLKWTLKERIDTTSTTSNTVEQPKTRKDKKREFKIKKQENRIEGRNEKVRIRKNSKANIKISKHLARQASKISKYENRKHPWWLVALSSFGGFCLTLLFIFIVIKIFKK